MNNSIWDVYKDLTDKQFLQWIKSHEIDAEGLSHDEIFLFHERKQAIEYLGY